MDFEFKEISDEEFGIVTGELTDELRAEVYEAVTKALHTFKQHFNRTFDVPAIVYDLKGHTAGYANSKRIRLNVELLYTHHDDMINRTIPHEVAHVVQRALYPWSKSHGYEWASLMYILGLPADRTHSYETTAARVRKREYEYECSCQTHMVTKTLHNRMQRGYTYTCRKCKGQLTKKGGE